MTRRSQPSPGAPAAAVRRAPPLGLGARQPLAQLRDLGARARARARSRQAGARRARGGLRRGRRAVAGGGDGLERGVARPPPAHARPVDVLERLGDAVPLAEVVDRPAALGQRAVVVDDHVAAGGEARVERRERRATSPRRCRRRAGRATSARPRARAASPRRSPGTKRDARAPARSARSSRCDLLDAARRGSRVGVQVALVVGDREALEGVGDDDGAVVGAERVERRAHQDRRAAAPGPGLDQVARRRRRARRSRRSAWRSSSRLRPTMRQPLHAASPCRPRAAAAPRRAARASVTLPSSHLPTETVRRAGQVAEAELEQLEVGAAQRLRLRAAGPGARAADLCQPGNPLRAERSGDVIGREHDHFTASPRNDSRTPTDGRSSSRSRESRRRSGSRRTGSTRSRSVRRTRSRAPTYREQHVLRGRLVRRPPGRVLRHRRPQRLGQEHAAEDHVEHLPRRRRADPHGRAAWRRSSSSASASTRS